MTYRMAPFHLTRWQMAILIGTPLTLGLGIYIYKRHTASKTKDKQTESPIATTNGSSKPLLINNAKEANATEEKRSEDLVSGDQSALQAANMLKDEGNVCYRNGKFDEAISYYDKAIALCPEKHRTDLAIFYQNRAAAYELLGKWSQVKEDCTISIMYNDQYAKAFFRRSKANEALNEMLECLDDITATCILEKFKNSTSIMFADRILKETGRNDADKHLEKRIPILPSRSCINNYLNAFLADPLQKRNSCNDNIVTGFCRALAALKSRNYNDIIPICTEEIESSESDSQDKLELLLLRGTFYLLAGSYAEGKQDLDIVIEKTDADVGLRVNALIKRSSIHIQQDLKELAMKDYEIAEQLQPDNPDIYHQRAQIYMLFDEFDSALNEFDMAIKLAPTNTMTYVHKCFAQYRMALKLEDERRVMMVIKEFKNVVEKYPSCAESYGLIAQVLSDQRQFVKADEYFQKAIDLQPDHAQLYVHRGVMQLQWKGDIITSMNYMNKALKVDNRCELAYEMLGTLEVQRGNLENAIEHFEKAITMAKNHAETCHLYALRNAAMSQINVKRKYGINVSRLSVLKPTGVN